MSEKRTAHPLVGLLWSLLFLVVLVTWLVGIPLLIGVLCRWAGLPPLSAIQVFLQIVSPLVTLVGVAWFWSAIDARILAPRRFTRWTARVETEPGAIPELIEALIRELRSGDADTLWAVLEPRLSQFAPEKASAARAAWAARTAAIVREADVVGPVWGQMDANAALEKALRALIEVGT